MCGIVAPRAAGADDAGRGCQARHPADPIAESRRWRHGDRVRKFPRRQSHGRLAVAGGWRRCAMLSLSDGERRKAAAGATRLAAGDADAFPRKFSLFYRDQDIVMNALEAESVEIIREAVATARKPVMMYSIGKDSSVMLHLARKAFHPAPPPFPLLHIDTGWKFQAMYLHRDRMVAESGMKLISHTNPEGLAAGVGPFSHGSNYHTDVMKTQGLKQALDAHGFDVVFGGARRDEEKSRAKERVFSFRAPGHRWDPKAQRPEL